VAQGKKRNNPNIVAKMEKAYINAIVGSDDLSAAGIGSRIKGVTRAWVRDVADDAVPWSDYVASTKLTKESEVRPPVPRKSVCRERSMTGSCRRNITRRTSPPRCSTA
jgi:hypothetical protein